MTDAAQRRDPAQRREPGAQAVPSPRVPPAPGHPDDFFEREALALAEQSAGVGVWSIDLTTSTVRATAQFFRIMGLPPTSDPIPVERVRALRHPDDRARVLAGFRAALEGGTDAYEIEYRIVRPDGELRWIFGRGRVVRDAAGTPVRYSGIDLDITDRKAAEAELARTRDALERLNVALEERVQERTAALQAEGLRRAHAEARLRQAQKMEAVGQLTGGIAHDFNNILQVILGNLEIAERVAPREIVGEAARGRLAASIRTAQRAARSARDLVQRLLAFSRLQNLEPTLLDVNALVAGMADMMQRTLGETIVVDFATAPDVWRVFVDSNQLETALLNLVVNARDAMPHGGRLRVETANETVHPGGSDEPSPGEYVVLTVRDTGFGIAADVLDKVFDPFFTTKDTGKGSGLGLSMVYGFVHQSGGFVRISSELAQGTQVRMWLPRARADGNLAHGDTPAPSLRERRMHDRGSLPRAQEGETVLIVEDNDEVRTLAATALGDLGYVVHVAGDAHAALAFLGGRNARIDLLFTDVVLPAGMSGVELSDQLHRLRPAVPVLFTSGYTRGSLVSPQGTTARILAKPYATASLARAVREAIDAGSAA